MWGSWLSVLKFHARNYSTVFNIICRTGLHKNIRRIQFLLVSVIYNFYSTWNTNKIFLNTASWYKSKGKGKVIPCFNWAPRYEGVLGSGVEIQLQEFLALALDGDKWSALCSDHFIPRKRNPGTHWIGGWVGPRADDMEYRLHYGLLTQI